VIEPFSTPNLLVFTSLAFAFFLPLVLGVHWSLPGHTARKAWLLGTSYFFYAAWDWRFLSLIWLSTGVDFVCGRRMAASDDDRVRRRWLVLSLVVNLGLLAFYKYANFFVDTAIELARTVGWGASERTFAVLLPVGISFYTFQTLSYTIDVYRRRIEPTGRLLDFALFVAFFPQLVAGPIVRASEFLPQLRTARRWANIDVRACVTLFLVGYVQKRCIADNVAMLVDHVYFEPAALEWSALVLAVLGFSVQLYGDFAGYSNMAIACAGLLGYRLPRNFDFPYLATNLVDFWRRWHITLSFWLRDYLYVPLGGNRHGRWRTAGNLLLVMLLGGLWHGAGWNFVLWGGLHGLALIACHLWTSTVDRLEAGRRRIVPRARAVVGTLLVFAWVTLLWIPFRAYTLHEAWLVTRAVLTGVSPGSRSVDPLWWPLLGGLAAVHVAFFALPVARWILGLPTWAYALWLGAATAVAISFSHRGVAPFVYFQF
jgi:alginate O-acetyltransferase complex protein AlgI